jgi:hypothetical protein
MRSSRGRHPALGGKILWSTSSLTAKRMCRRSHHEHRLGSNIARDQIGSVPGKIAEPQHDITSPRVMPLRQQRATRGQLPIRYRLNRRPASDECAPFIPD